MDSGNWRRRSCDRPLPRSGGGGPRVAWWRGKPRQGREDMPVPTLTLKRARRLRREMSKPETILWAHLRRNAMGGQHFRRQHPLGPYILDFYCSAIRLCVEIDGLTHATPEAARHDEIRSEWLRTQGVRIIRFAASDVLDRNTVSSVLATIEWAASPSTARAVPLPRFAGEAVARRSSAPPRRCPPDTPPARGSGR